MDRSPYALTRAARSMASVALLSLAALVGACSSSDDQPPTYAQADLAGTWDVATFWTGIGWERETVTIDASGTPTTAAYMNSGFAYGSFGPRVLHVAGNGEVTETRGGIATAFHGTLARDKRLLAGVATPAELAHALIVARKRDGAVTFAADDLRGRTFALHSLRTGADGEWRYGTGSIDAQGVVSLDSAIGPSLLPVAPPAPHGATLLVDAAGFVSDGGAFEGFLTADKNTLISVFTDPAMPGASHQLTILQFTGGAFAQGDLEGEWAFAALAGNVGPTWWHGSLDIDATGVTTYLSQVDSAGSAVLSPSETFVLASDGTITVPATNPSYRGTVSLSKDLYVRTKTHNPPGRYGIGVALRR